jgi:hypothetical protein
MIEYVIIVEDFLYFIVIIVVISEANKSGNQSELRL